MKWKPISEKPEYKRDIICTNGEWIAEGRYNSRKKLQGWSEFYSPGCYEDNDEMPTHWMYFDDLLKGLT